MADTVRVGDEAEATEIGGIVNRIIDFIEQMDLPPHLDDLKCVIVADAGTEGICAGTAAYTEPREVAAALMEHSSVLLGTLGIGMEVMTADELGAMMNIEDKA